MVKMRGHTSWSVWGVDLACGAIASTLACVTIWLLVAYMDTSDKKLNHARKDLSNARQSLATLQVAYASQQDLILHQTADLAERGTLPSEFPNERYFHDLALWAAHAGVTIQSQIPMVAAEYPGLIEQRSQIEISGSLQAILNFFETIEQSTYWADVGYFALAQGGSGKLSSLNRSARFTLSMFSAISIVNDQSKDGTS